jgi:hypothetical protein
MSRTPLPPNVGEAASGGAESAKRWPWSVKILRGRWSEDSTNRGVEGGGGVEREKGGHSEAKGRRETWEQL